MRRSASRWCDFQKQQIQTTVFMAGDWIKMEHTTPDKPEVVGIAARLKIEQDSVTGKLSRIWIWADQNSVDGSAVGITEAFIDALTRKRGFAAAMRVVGWLEGDDGALSFPGFLRHNGTSAKVRAETNRRVAKHRKGKQNVTQESLQKPLPEKRREEESTLTECPHSPPEGDGVIQNGCGEETGRKPDLWEIVRLYPKRHADKDALEALQSSVRKGSRLEDIEAGTRAIAAVIPKIPGGALNSYVVGAGSFFRGERWRDDPKTWLRNGTKTGEAHKAYEPNGRQPAEVISLGKKP